MAKRRVAPEATEATVEAPVDAGTGLLPGLAVEGAAGAPKRGRAAPAKPGAVVPEAAPAPRKARRAPEPAAAREVPPAPSAPGMTARPAAAPGAFAEPPAKAAGAAPRRKGKADAAAATRPALEQASPPPRERRGKPAAASPPEASALRAVEPPQPKEARRPEPRPVAAEEEDEAPAAGRSRAPRRGAGVDLPKIPPGTGIQVNSGVLWQQSGRSVIIGFIERLADGGWQSWTLTRDGWAATGRHASHVEAMQALPEPDVAPPRRGAETADAEDTAKPARRATKGAGKPGEGKDRKATGRGVAA